MEVLVKETGPCLIILSILFCYPEVSARFDIQAGDDEWVRVNLSESFVYYTTAQNTLFVSICAGLLT